MIVVADTSPLNYLIQIESEHLLPQLYQRVLVPLAVIRELRNRDAPQIVRRWASRVPSWLEVLETANAPYPDLAYLDPGEREAIQLAQERSADLLLIDERKGRLAAQRRGLMTTGTLGVLLRAGELGFADPVATYQRLVSKTSFRTSASLETHFLEMVSRTHTRPPLIEKNVPLEKRQLPNLIVHCDWGSTPQKRWMAKAVLEKGKYVAYAPKQVDPLNTLFNRVQNVRGESGVALVGFDFPIGIPMSYANQLDKSEFEAPFDFIQFLKKLGKDKWANFYTVNDNVQNVTIHRPFYPNKSGQAGDFTQGPFLERLNVDRLDQLRRACERPQPNRRAASPLFWTLGGNQVGKAAIIGWKEVIEPAVQTGSIKLWPFEGPLDFLLQPASTVVVETYPTQYHDALTGGRIIGKSDIGVRQDAAASLLTWAEGNSVTLTPTLSEMIRLGFPAGKDDAFDAVLGLFGMIDAVKRNDAREEPVSQPIREIEGWILGLPGA